MRTLEILAFLLFAIAALIATFDKAWPFALLAAGLAAYVAPAAFQLTS